VGSAQGLWVPAPKGDCEGGLGWASILYRIAGGKVRIT